MEVLALLGTTCVLTRRVPKSLNGMLLVSSTHPRHWRQDSLERMGLAAEISFALVLDGPDVILADDMRDLSQLGRRRSVPTKQDQYFKEAINR